MLTNRNPWIGIQVRAECANEGLVEFYPTVGTYGWVVPEHNDIARVGLCARKDAKSIFDRFLLQRGVGKILSYQGGLIPEYLPSVTTSKGPVRLVGDAATHVKATTGGGIIQSLIAGEALSHSIHTGENYDRAWRAKLGRDLWIHLKMRTVMDRFTPADWEYLITLFEQDKLRTILETHDREYPSRFLLSMFLKEPRLAYFGRFFFGG